MHGARQAVLTQGVAQHAERPGVSGGPPADLLAALNGLDADRERAVGHRTRRVVMSSLKVQQEQKSMGSRARAFALAGTVLVILLITPLVWEAADSLFAGEHWNDPGNQIGLWACIIGPALLGAALMAAWWKKSS
jgi:hypothetical protein